MGQQQLTFVDLFCGAGGFSAGMRAAGLVCLGGVDLDATACATYQANHGAAMRADARALRAEDVMRLTGGVAPDVLVASPPCQSISACGAAVQRVVPADALWREAVRLAAELGVRAVALENVARFATKRDADGTPLADAAGAALREAGFATVQHMRLDAADFGAPQRRRRAFVVGLRDAAAPPLDVRRTANAPRTFRDVAATAKQARVCGRECSRALEMSWSGACVMRASPNPPMQPSR